jgi:lactate racemase
VADTFRARIPYESMDPLAIGATDDESKKHRDSLELEIPSANLVAAIYPEEPEPVGDATEAARAALAAPVDGPSFAEILAGKASVAVIIDNQFRPTPSSKLLPAVFDAIEAAGVADVRVCCANGKVFPMSESDMEQKLGRDNLARMERNGWPFRQNDPQNPDAYTFVGVSSGGTPVWLLNEVASADAKITIGQAQANHWGAGGGGKLILPGVVSDETVESNHCAFVTSPQTHYGAYVGPMRSDIDEVATMCGLDCTMNVILDTHGRVADVVFGSHPEAHREAIRRFNAIYAYESFVPDHGQADIAICGVFAPTDHLFFHTGWGCMSADLVVKDGGTIIYTSPSPGVSTAIGDFPGLALMDLMTPYMPPTAENYQRVLRDIHSRTIQMWAGCIWVPIYEVMTRKHLSLVTLDENLAMAADIGIDATTSLDEAFAAAMERHGPDAKVAVLPFARYQLPRNAVRMEPADERLFAVAGRH